MKEIPLLTCTGVKPWANTPLLGSFEAQGSARLGSLGISYPNLCLLCWRLWKTPARGSHPRSATHPAAAWSH